MAIVYKITCAATGKIYIGWTTLDLKTRWRRHLVCDKKCYIQHCIKKYGKDSFSIEPLYEFANNEDAIAKEIDLIATLKTNMGRYPDGNGMNMTDGGEGTIGYKFTDEHRRKLSKATKGRKHKPSTIELMSQSRMGDKNPMYGKSSTEKQRETARKLFRENNPHKKGELSHMFGKPGYMLGRKHSPESIKKMKGHVSPMKGKRHSPESLEKMSKATKKFLAEKGHPNQGKKFSEESKEKMRASRIAFFEKQKVSENPYRHSEATKEKLRKVVRKRKDERNAAMVAFYAEAKSIKKTAKRFGIARSSAQQIIKKYKSITIITGDT